MTPDSRPQAEAAPVSVPALVEGPLLDKPRSGCSGSPSCTSGAASWIQPGGVSRFWALVISPSSLCSQAPFSICSSIHSPKPLYLTPLFEIPRVTSALLILSISETPA